MYLNIMSKRTISINPHFFNVSKKKKKIIPSQVNINAGNIRQLLLDKLKEHKKTRKVKMNSEITPQLQDKTFEESCKENEKINESKSDTIESDKIPVPIHETLHENLTNPINSISSNPSNQSDKPYGNLKNGTKPTYKQMYQENIQETHIQENEDFQDIPQKEIILEEKEVKKIFKLGKNPKTKTISILIKNNKTRKKVEDTKTEREKKHLATVKNYLKEKNLIKFGSTAPSKLLREMYESSELCGGISNQNKDVLIHNFNK